MSTAENRLFEATFNIANVNNQKYDRVSRISGNSLDEANIFFSLDVNTELYPCNEGEKVQILLALSLNADGTKDDTKGWREVGRGDMTLADDYEYVCHGKIYKFEESEDDNIKVFVSFGGLLFYMDGPYDKLSPLRIDYVYLLMKK